MIIVHFQKMKKTIKKYYFCATKKKKQNLSMIYITWQLYFSQKVSKIIAA